MSVSVTLEGTQKFVQLVHFRRGRILFRRASRGHISHPGLFVRAARIPSSYGGHNSPAASGGPSSHSPILARQSLS